MQKAQEQLSSSVEEAGKRCVAHNRSSCMRLILRGWSSGQPHCPLAHWRDLETYVRWPLSGDPLCYRVPPPHCCMDMDPAMDTSANGSQSKVCLCRGKQAQELCRQRETELAEARAEADALIEALDAERAAAGAAAGALQGTLEQQHAADKATALGDAYVGFTQQLQDQREQLEKELAAQSVQLKVY